jgi:formate/nitrite transporter FocA (FNT family)
VEEKQTKMRETLRMMSLTSFNYSLSFFLTLMASAVFAGVVFGLGLFGSDNVFPDQGGKSGSILFGLSVIMFGLGQIPFLMSLSTLFSDSKLAS